MHILKKLRVLGFALAGLVPLLSTIPVFAASATMSLSSAGSATKGYYVTVTLHENSGAEPINAARATLSYPTSQLQFISISSSSAFSIVAANSGGGGSVNIDRGALPAVSGSQTVASVTFKALTDSGTAVVNIASGQVISANSNSDILAGTSGTSIGLHAPVAAPPPPPKDTTPPAISKVAIKSITPTSAIVSWTTSEPATDEVSYGLTKSYGLVAVNTTAATDHNVTLNSPLIEPGITYHYSIKSTDPSGNASTTNDATFTTVGAVLIASVKDQNNKPLAGAVVEFDGQKAPTNKQGVANLTGLSLGKKYGVITYKGDKYPVSADIKSADKPQSATLQINIKPNYTLPIIILILILLVLDFIIGQQTGHGGGKGLTVATVSSLWFKLKQRLSRPGSDDVPPPPDVITPEL